MIVFSYHPIIELWDHFILLVLDHIEILLSPSTLLIHHPTERAASHFTLLECPPIEKAQSPSTLCQYHQIDALPAQLISFGVFVGSNDLILPLVSKVIPVCPSLFLTTKGVAELASIVTIGVLPYPYPCPDGVMIMRFIVCTELSIVVGIVNEAYNAPAKTKPAVHKTNPLKNGDQYCFFIGR